MPTYDYKCTNCEYEFEKFQSMTARPLRKCPNCGKNTLNKLIGTGAAVIFKGSGFYQTDYRSDGYKQAQKKETDARKPKTEDKKTDVAKTEKSDTKSAPKDAKKDKPKHKPA
ncbi:MAG: zinc ribbon domain-containing protein [Phycisphaerae bacterium]